MVGVADISNDAQRQLERAGRLLDFQPHRKTTPVHKSLEQHFCEARGLAPGAAAAAAAGLQPGQAPGLAGAGLGGIGLGGAAGAAHSRVLHGPKLQRLDREVEVFVLGPSSTTATRATPAAAVTTAASGAAGATTGAAPGGDTTATWLPPVDEKEKDLGVAEFFGHRHERVLLCAMEEAQRDCLRSFERHSFDRIQSDWAEAKAQIMASISPQGLGPAGTAGSTGSTTRGVAWGGGSDASHAVVSAPPQDAAIIDALLREPVSQALAQRIGRLSGDSCQPYRSELNECWSIVAASMRPTPREISCGALHYLQARYADELRATVYRLPGTHIGGVPDAWCLVRAFGRAKFGAAGFPNDPAHVWYAAFVAARAGFAQLLAELPTKAAPAAERCPMLRSVCALMARRLLATSTPEQQQPFTGGAGVDAEDSADLLRADLSEEGNAFHDVLVSLLLNRSFSMGALPEGTVEDWVWFRLHALNLASKDSDQAPEFAQHMQAMRTHVSSLPATHFDPPVVAGPSALGMSPGLMDPLGMSMAGATAAAAGGAVTAQTLNLVKVLLLTAQFDKAVQQLWSQDRCLRAPALHMALALHRAGTLKVVAGPQAEAPSIAGLVCDYASHFSCGDQLQYFRILDLRDRVQALQRMLLRGGVGTNDELLGYIDDFGGHQPGLLERTLHEEGLGDRAEFTQLCATAGFAAAEHGQYREAVRLLHLGGRHGEVLQVLCRCLRLPIWREPAAAASEEAARLGQDIQRFFAMYERKLDAYGIQTQDWAVARKLYAARLFHGLCESGQPEAAVDLFDREQLLPLSSDMPTRGEDISPEALAEYPRIVGDYVRILRHAASQGLLVVAGLRERLQKLQSFLALHSHHLALDQETVSILAGLALS